MPFPNSVLSLGLPANERCDVAAHPLAVSGLAAFHPKLPRQHSTQSGQYGLCGFPELDRVALGIVEASKASNAVHCLLLSDLNASPSKIAEQSGEVAHP